MSRRAVRALDVPEWLLELAARDDPPTTIDDEFVARLRRAGVEALSPADGERILPVEDADRAKGIAPVVPGLAYAWSFEPGPAPVAAALAELADFVERFDRLRRLRLAAIDMRMVEQAARALRNRDGPARLFERVLETGLVVTYARPYLDSNQSGGVRGKRWLPEDPADREFHRRLIDELRDPYHAHADRTPRRTLTDTAAMLGLEGAPTYAEAWWRLTDSELEQLAELARRQAERLEAAAKACGRELGERRNEHDEGRHFGGGDRRAHPR